MTNQRKNISEIKKRVEARLKSVSVREKIEAFLMGKGLSRQIVEKVSANWSNNAMHSQEIDPFKLLQLSLAQQIKISTSFGKINRKPRCSALIGPPGVGKTTVCLKLANHFQEHEGLKVAVISIDDIKPGASVQLKEHADEYNVPCYPNPEAIFKEGVCDLILVDTPGCQYYQDGEIDRLSALLRPFGFVDLHLILSATSKDVDLYGAVHCFSILPIESLIFTKLDETLSAGVIVNISSQVEIPISFIGYGYPLPGNLQVADAKEITRKILTEKNDEIHQFLREFSYSRIS